MGRLTQADRDSIVEVMLNKQLREKGKKLRAARNKEGDKIYEALFTEKERAGMYALPEGFLDLSESLYFSTGAYFWFSAPKRLPTDREVYRNRKVDREAYDKADAALDEHLKHEKQVALQISGVLRSVATWKKLYEIWPEAKDVLVKLEPASGEYLPSVIPQTLNAEIGLP